MKEIESIVVASKNPAKVERYGKLLSLYISQVVGLSDLGITDQPEENGETAEQNAEIKGKHYAQRTGMLVFSEDEALYVDFLPENQQPGVHVRRINGKDEVDDETLLSYWEQVVSAVPEEERAGKWHIAYCIAHPDGTIHTVSLDHPIMFFSPPSNVRIPGWPMSSLQGPSAFGKPHSELTQEERELADKRADEAIVKKLQELFNLER